MPRSPLPTFQSAAEVIAFIDQPESNEFIPWMVTRSDLLRAHAQESIEVVWDSQILQLFGQDFRSTPYLIPLAEIGGVKIPDPDGFPPEAREYALNRANDTQNPILEARYLDFAFEQKVDRHVARRAVEAYMRASVAHLVRYGDDDSNDAFDRAHQAVECVGRAFVMALRAGLADERGALVEECLRLAKELLEGPHPNLVPQLIEALLMWTNWRDADQLTRARDSLEQAISACSYVQTVPLLGLVELLSVRLKDNAGVVSARRRVGEAEEQEADSRADSGLIRCGLLRRALDAYQRVPDLEACRRVEVKIREAIAQSETEMRTFESSTTLDFAQWDDFVREMIAEFGRDSIFRLVANDHNLPSLEKAKDISAELIERFPLRSLVTNIIVTNDTLNQFNSREEFLERDTRKTYGWELSMRFVYLGRAMRMMSHEGCFDEARVLEALGTSEFFAGRDAIWSRGIERYFAQDYISFLHIMLPQIEEAVRALTRAAGIRITRIGRDGQMDLKPLGGLLSALRSLLNDELTDFLEYVLCHRLGWSLRNLVLHGIADAGAFNGQTSDVVLWIALRLSLLRVHVEVDATVGSRAAPPSPHDA